MTTKKETYATPIKHKLSSIYLTPGVVFRVVFRDVTRFECDLNGKMSERKDPWVDFYNSKGHYVWDCNREFFKAHFEEVPKPQPGEFRKKKAKPTRAREIAMSELREVMRQLHVLKMDAERLRAELGLSEDADV
jgi:hypothetical protein